MGLDREPARQAGCHGARTHADQRRSVARRRRQPRILPVAGRHAAVPQRGQHLQALPRFELERDGRPDDLHVKIREDAIYQDGTPVKAADLKAYWEHGGKPENIIAWGGSMLLGLRDIKGMQDLMAGDTTVAEGLVAIDDNTLEVTMESAVPTFPHVVTIDQTGFTKLEQVLADPDDWHFAPIGVGPTQWSSKRTPDTRR